MASRPAALLFALLAAQALSQGPQSPNRGATAASIRAPGDWQPKRRIVVTIGINQYQNWPRLNNAVSDAPEVASVLRAAGFLEIVPPLKPAPIRSITSSSYSGMPRIW